MEFSDVVRRRRMVRAYTDEPIDRSIVTGLLELAIRAPSAGFSQGWHFLVLETPADRDRFWTATTDPDSEPDRWLTGMRSAPVLVLALSDKRAYLERYAEQDKGWTDRDESHWPVPYWDVDTGMASLLILLGAVDQGLGACFFGVPVPRMTAVRSAFGIDEAQAIVGVISLGRPAPDRRSPSLRRGRRGLEDVVSFGKMGQ